MTDWIVIPNWDEFQHYKGRRPIWIKVYVSLLDDPDFRGLTDAQKGILFSLWLAYAQSDAQLPYSAAYLARAMGLYTEWEVRRWREGGEYEVSELREMRERMLRGRDLKALEKAGFIERSASRPLARRYQNASPEKEVEREKALKDFDFNNLLKNVPDG